MKLSGNSRMTRR